MERPHHAPKGDVETMGVVHAQQEAAAAAAAPSGGSAPKGGAHHAAHAHQARGPSRVLLVGTLVFIGV